MTCVLCGKPSNHKHHLFSRTKWALKLYGANLIDSPINLVDLCVDCHLNQPIPKFTELEFCMSLGIAPRSKTERLRFGLPEKSF